MAKPSVDKSFHTALLIGKYLRGQLTENEKKELDAWISASEQNRQLFVELCSAKPLDNQLIQFGNADNVKGWQNIEKKIAERNSRVSKIPAWKIGLQSAAAILIVVFATWQVWYHTSNREPLSIKLVSKYGEDVLPGKRKAELVLSEGTIIKLDDDKDTVFKDKGNIIQKTSGGSIVYSRDQSDELAGWNSIHIPNGGEYVVILEDGTKVWINAASSLRYPVHFTAKERRVELTEGEAYFEVAKNKEKPFIVVAERMSVQAVGTAFNVNSYNCSDSSNLTTLAEGKIKVITKIKTVFVEPGQEVKADLNSAAVSKGNVESAIAWKNGLFIFSGIPLQDVMQQLSRWYDARIVYDKTFLEKKLFTGEIKRSVPVSKLLQMMEMTGIARFKIAKKVITILPYSPK
jgi:transmembrane sensor